MNKKKILMLPLDERPCNLSYPQMLLKDNAEYELIMPKLEQLGKKKASANFEVIKDFLLSNVKNSIIAILSIDMLVFGGLCAGRVHQLSKSELMDRLDVIKQMKELNPSIKIYAFHLIMRCPTYSSSDEEPDYYEICGREIFLYGEALHKKQLGFENVNEKQYFDVVSPYVEDFTKRREKNLAVNFATIDLLGEYIDTLIIPQDDSAPYGYVAIDQQRVRDYVFEKKKELDVLIYPGADEVGLTLLARSIMEDKGIRYRISTFFSSSKSQFVVPKYEDRILGESVKLQIEASGCKYSHSFDENDDIILAINAPADNMTEAEFQGGAVREYTIDRTLNLFAKEIVEYVSIGKMVAVGDVAYSNGSDLQLVKMLDDAGVSLKVGSIAGWNTSGNTLGTVISTAILRSIFGDTKAIQDFIAYRYFEDAGYCAVARKKLIEYLTENKANIRSLDSFYSKSASFVLQTLNDYMESQLPNVFRSYKLESCDFPWNRTFEVKLDIKRK